MKKIALVTVLSLTVFALIATPVVQADYLLDRSGSLVFVDGSILGDDDEQKTENESEKEVENEVEESRASSDSQNNMEREREMRKKQEEQNREAAKKTLERQIEARQQKNERNELRSKLEVETEGGKFKLKQETKDKYGRTTSQEVELKEGESLHIEDESGEETLELRLMQEMGQRGDKKLEIIKNKIKSETKLPLSVNENNELIITRPDGTTKVVTVLPDQAVENMRRRGIVAEDSATTPELTENESGEPVYRLETEVERRILGLKLKFKRAAEVSAETGELESLNLETNPLKRWLANFVFTN